MTETPSNTADKPIIIDLDNIRARRNKKSNTESNHFYLDEYYKDIKKHIKICIDEVSKTSKQDFFDSRMHDSILIYGTRGNGKTTIMINLKEMIENLFKDDNDNVMVIDVIDPTVLEPSEDFLLVVLSTIMNSVESHHKNQRLEQREEHHREKFYTDLEEILHKIESTHMSEDRGEIFDKFYGDKTAVGLAKSLHDFFYNVTKIFDVNTIIIPIDDIDMNMKQGYNIAETIRKYLSSPYIIPVVSFNIKQMRAVVKYNKYKAFGINLTDKELENHKDLDFLYSIPTDYLASIFPPDRRIILKSIFDILKQYDKEEDGTSKLFFYLSELVENHNDDKKNYSISLNIMINILSSIIFENHFSKNLHYTPISNYLTHRSTRDFLKDCHAIMNALSKDDSDKNIYSLNYGKIRNRFSPDDKGVFIKYQQALAYLWDEFIILSQKNLSRNSRGIPKVKNNWPKIITEVSYDNQSDEVNKKLYRRLWLQKYYLTQSTTKINNIYLSQQSDKLFSIEKTYKLTGVIELAMRSYIPMYLFETIMKNNNFKYSAFDFMSLKEFAEKDLIDVAYELSTFEIMLKRKSAKKQKPEDYKVFGSVVISSKKDELYEAEYNIPYLFKLRNQDQIFKKQSDASQQVYFFSIFKVFALFIEIVNLKEKKNKEGVNEIEEENKQDILNLLEKYRINIPCLNDNNFVENYYLNSIESTLENLTNFLNIKLKKSKLGILEVVSFSQKIVEYFFELRANTNLDYSFSEINLKKNIWLCDKEKSNLKKNTCYICVISKKANKEMLQIKEINQNKDSKSMLNVKKTKCFKFIAQNSEGSKWGIGMQMKKNLTNLINNNTFINEEIGTLSNYFHYPLSAYLTSFSQALLISLAESSKSKDKTIDTNIYTRNSFHGANIMILKRETNGEILLAQKSSYFFQNMILLKNGSENYKKIYTYFSNMMEYPFFESLFANYKEKHESTENCKFRTNIPTSKLSQKETEYCDSLKKNKIEEDNK